MSVFDLTKLLIVVKAEEASRDSRLTKQDRYAEIRRRKEEEREAKERMLVGCLPFLLWYLGISIVGFLVRNFVVILLGRRSQGSTGQGGGNCCVGV